MNKLKIVILAGAIYPHISPRSFRSTELAKGFAKLGHDVTLWGLLGDYDYAQFEEETKVKVKNYGRSYLGNVNSDSKHISDNKLYRYFRAGMTRLFSRLIDYPRCEYFFHSLRALKQEKEFDYLITVAHPFGLHWGAAFYKKTNKNKFKFWASDCGDPLMGSTNSNRFSVFLEPIEKAWCSQTDVITIPVTSSIDGYYPEFRKKIEVIPQSVDFSAIELSEYKKNSVPTFFYSGAVFPGIRDPSQFLSFLCNLDEDFKFIAYLPNKSIFEKYAQRLGKRLEIREYIPRNELIKVMSEMDFLINFKNRTEKQQPSKLIDYGISKRPILDISNDFSKQEQEDLTDFFAGKYTAQKNMGDISRFDSENVCQQFVELYKKGCKKIENYH